MPSVLKLSLPLNQQFIKIDFKNIQELYWDKMTEELKLGVYKFRIDVKEDNVNKCREILPIVLYLAVVTVLWFLRKLNAIVAKI